MSTNTRRPTPTLRRCRMDGLLNSNTNQKFFPHVTLRPNAKFNTFRRYLGRQRAIQVNRIPRILTSRIKLTQIRRTTTLTIMSGGMAIRARTRFTRFFRRTLLHHLVTHTINMRQLSRAFNRLRMIFRLHTFTHRGTILSRLHLLLTRLPILRRRRYTGSHGHRSRQRSARNSSFIFRLRIPSYQSQANSK